MRPLLRALARLEVWCAVALGALADMWASSAVHRLGKISESFPRRSR
jgi:hypothetical protein